jgi:hypothetical protein
MNPETKSLIRLLYLGRINNKEFLKKYFKDNLQDEEYCRRLIRQGIEEKNPETIEESIVLLYTGFFKTSNLIFELCELLSMDWHMKHEDIAMLLTEANDPASVECLYHAAELEFDYLSYDDTCQFGRKCIKALAKIADGNAINKLRMLSNSANSVLGDYAKKELEYKGLW